MNLGKRMISLRKMTEEDQKPYLRLIGEETGVDMAYMEPFADIFLGTDNMYIFSVTDAQTDEYLGYVEVKHTDTKTPELGISIRREYQGCGIGTEAMRKAAEYYAANHRMEYFLIRMKGFNKASQRMAEKLGAYRIDDEGDMELERIRQLVAEIDTEESRKIFGDYLKEYSLANENVQRYRYNPSLVKYRIT